MNKDAKIVSAVFWAGVIAVPIYLSEHRTSGATNISPIEAEVDVPIPGDHTEILNKSSDLNDAKLNRAAKGGAIVMAGFFGAICLGCLALWLILR